MTPDPKDYKPVPVEAAKAIAEQYDKSIVIVFAHDPVYGQIHTTTYGSDPQNKAWAAQGGEIATKALGGLTELATDFEDYRLAQARKLLAALKAMSNAPGDPYSMNDARQLAWTAIEEAEKFLGN